MTAHTQYRAALEKNQLNATYRDPEKQYTQRPYTPALHNKFRPVSTKPSEDSQPPIQADKPLCPQVMHAACVSPATHFRSATIAAYTGNRYRQFKREEEAVFDKEAETLTNVSGELRFLEKS